MIRHPLLLIGTLLLPLGRGGKDDPAGPSFPTLAVTTTSLPNAAPTVAYSETVVATGGDGSYAWSVAVGSLPTGVSLVTEGAITGTPTGASSTFTLQVESGDGQTATRQLTIVVYDVLAVSTVSLPSGVTSTAYSETLAATGGDGGYSWALSSGSGSLPTGLNLGWCPADS